MSERNGSVDIPAMDDDMGMMALPSLKISTARVDEEEDSNEHAGNDLDALEGAKKKRWRPSTPIPQGRKSTGEKIMEKCQGLKDRIKNLRHM